jgi:hypothetical protein
MATLSFYISRAILPFLNFLKIFRKKWHDGFLLWLDLFAIYIGLIAAHTCTISIQKNFKMISI